MHWGAFASTWLPIALLAGAFLFVRRYGGGAALAELERANRVLTNRCTELTADVVRLTGEVAALRARTDVGLAIAPVLEALKLHEERAAARADRTLDVLDLIASRFGPEREAA